MNTNALDFDHETIVVEIDDFLTVKTAMGHDVTDFELCTRDLASRLLLLIPRRYTLPVLFLHQLCGLPPTGKNPPTRNS